MYAAVGLSAATATVILVAFRAMDLVPVPAITLPSVAFRGVIIALLAGATVTLRLVRATLPSARADVEAWWAAAVGRALAIRALADGAAILRPWPIC